METKLRELLAAWRLRADRLEHPEIERKRMLLLCISELQKVLDEETQGN